MDRQDTQSLWNCWNGWTITKWILFLNEHISNQETLLQSPGKNKMEGGGNEFNTYTGCPCDLSSNINFSLFIYFIYIYIILFILVLKDFFRLCDLSIWLD